MIPLLRFFCSILTSLIVLPAGAAPVISEFAASSRSVDVDDTGALSDWIELSNDTDNEVNMLGWALTDNVALPSKWVFPAVSIPAHGYLRVWASGLDHRDPARQLHTNFTLSAKGEYLGLVTPGGICQSCYPLYPPQFSGLTYGTFLGGGLGWMSPTPGEENVASGFADYVRDTHFSVAAGFYSAAFPVTLSTATPGAEIRYTVDGSVPDQSTGILYTGPVNISTTSVLQVRAFSEGMVPSNKDTVTYVFAGTWKAQPDFPAGFSFSWGNSFPNNGWKIRADYGMNTEVTNNAVTGPQVIPALTQSFPVLCINGGRDAIFGEDGLHGNLRHSDAEVPVSVEYFNPLAPAERFTTRATLQIHGAAAREFAKKPFRLDFTGPDADGALTFPLFAGSPVEKFEQLVLRGGGHDSWAVRTRGGKADHNDNAYHATYMRDQFIRATALEMGLPAVRGRYVHLCLNGLYWGIYDLHERPQAEYCAAYSGGTAGDWDVLHQGSSAPALIDGTADAWNGLMDLAAAGVSNPAQYTNLMNLIGGDAFIDHMLLRMWSADHDWLSPVFMPSTTLGTTANVGGNNRNNWYVWRRSRGVTGLPWQFAPWDAEITMGNHLLFVITDGTGPEPAGLDFPRMPELRLDMTGVSKENTPAALWSALITWPEFQLKVADRARRMLFANGALSPALAAARVERLRQILDPAMIAESARWGTVSGHLVRPINGISYRFFDNPLLTKSPHWTDAVAYLRDTWCTERNPVFIDQLKSRGLYPATPPADITPAGGALAPGQTVSLTTEAAAGGRIYYKTDGTDPRAAETGDIAAGALVYTAPLAGVATVHARVLNNGSWSALTSAAFSQAQAPSAAALAITEVYYHPSPASAAEAAAGFTDVDDFEFIELTNISTSRIALRELRFAAGIDFDFATGSNAAELAAGASLVIAKNAAAFAFRFGQTSAGIFQNGTGLSNAGERIKLVTAGGIVIAEFTYNDRSPWPAGADGAGRGLTLIAPRTGTVEDRARAWRAAIPTPGSVVVSVNYAAWLPDSFSPAEIALPAVSGALADPDRDGLPNVIEFMTLSDPREASKSPLKVNAAATGMEFTWQERADATGVNVVMELSTSLRGWVPAASGSGMTISTVPSQDGSVLHTLGIAFPAPVRFGRLKASWSGF